MTLEQIDMLIDSIPEQWYETAVRTLEVGIATRYYAYNRHEHLYSNNTTVLSFLIGINNVKHMSDDYFDEDGIFQRIDAMLRGITRDIAGIFTKRLLIMRGHELMLSSESVYQIFMPKIIEKISKLSDALRNKTISYIAIRNEKEVASIIGNTGECGNEYQQIVHANMLNGIIPVEETNISLANPHFYGGVL